MLSDEQVKHFNAFGFLKLPGVFTAAEMEVIRREMQEVVAELAPGRAGSEHVKIAPFTERRSFLAQLIDDDRIHGIPASILGPDFLFELSEGHVRYGDTPWHGGGHQWGLRNIKLSIYLDSLTKENGCLRVVPGSHRGYLRLLDSGWDEAPDHLRSEVTRDNPRPFGVEPSDLPAVYLDSDPGDVIVHTEAVLHGAFGGSARWQINLSFMENPTTEAQVSWVQEHYEMLQEGLRTGGDPNSYSALRPARSYLESDSPRIRRMVSKLAELGFEPLDL
jgi:hypothetical protein